MSRVDSLLDHALGLRNEAGEYLAAGAADVAAPMLSMAMLEAVLALALVQRARAAHARKQPGLDQFLSVLQGQIARVGVSGPTVASDGDAWVGQIEAVIVAARDAIPQMGAGNPARVALESALAAIATPYTETNGHAPGE